MHKLQGIQRMQKDKQRLGRKNAKIEKNALFARNAETAKKSIEKKREAVPRLMKKCKGSKESLEN